MTDLDIGWPIIDIETGKPTSYFESIWRDNFDDGGLSDQVAQNTSNIQTNEGGISSNASAISTNATNISENSTLILAAGIESAQILAGSFWDDAIVVTTGDWTMNSLTLTVDLAIVDGGTGASDATTALFNLGGQPLDAGLTSISALITVADTMIYTTALDVYATTSLTAFARTLLDDADAATARTTLDAQQLDAGLTSIAGLVTSADKMIYTTASDVYATTDLSVFARTLLDDTTQGEMRVTLDVDQSGTTPLGDLSDVTITTPLASQHLIYSGTAWVNETPNRRIDGGDGAGDVAEALFTIDGGSA